MTRIIVASIRQDRIDEALRHAKAWQETVKVMRRSAVEAEVVVNTGYEREADRSFLEKVRRLMMSIFSPLEVVVRDVQPTKNKKNDRVSGSAGNMLKTIMCYK